MKTDGDFFSINDFYIANKPKELNKADYIHAFFSQQGFPKDIEISLLDLISPIFEFTDGVLLLKEFHEKNEYNRLIQEKAGKETIQFWSNMIDLTDIFECDDYLKVKDLADGLSYVWNKKIEELGYQNIAVAKTYLEEDDESVYITIAVPSL
ncbi:hypothetical protein OHK33_20630 [Pectobacterium aroidearum]|uniref:hypothetical protein n=1 Tax=Pectobacterium aroidearum TaxID=1201031 RepID=UPI0033069DB1